MIRHRCAVCASLINRTDRLFEDSDGTLCAACLARLAPVAHTGAQPGAATPRPQLTPPPAWAVLPELIARPPGQG